MVWDLWGSLILVISVCSRVSKDDAKIYDFRMWLLRCRRGRICPNAFRGTPTDNNR